MPKFNTLDEAQKWIDDIGDKAVSILLMKETEKTFPPVATLKRPTPTDEEILAYLESQSNRITKLVNMADSTAKVMGLTLDDILKVHSFLALYGIKASELDRLIAVPKFKIQAMQDELALIEQRVQSLQREG